MHALQRPDAFQGIIEIADQHIDEVAGGRDVVPAQGLDRPAQCRQLPPAIAGQPERLQPGHLGKQSSHGGVDQPAVQPLVDVETLAQRDRPLDLADAVLVGQDVVVQEQDIAMGCELLEIGMGA